MLPGRDPISSKCSYIVADFVGAKGIVSSLRELRSRRWFLGFLEGDPRSGLGFRFLGNFSAGFEVSGFCPDFEASDFSADFEAFDFEASEFEASDLSPGL